MSSADERETDARSLADLIRAVACARSRSELNRAMFDLHKAAWPMLRPMIAWGLNQRRVHGLGASLAEPEDIYNEVLQRIGEKASRFRGRSAAEAEAWIKKIARNLIEDSVKTARRRRQRWRDLESMARRMFPGMFDPDKGKQEQDDDG